MTARRWKYTGFGILALLTMGVAPAVAAPCGTIASPTSCSLTVNGTTTFTASNFVLLSAAGSGGGTVYEGADIAIDIFGGGGGIGGLTFTKAASGPALGGVFFANPGQVAAFTFSYDLVLTAAQPGTATFGPDFQVAMTQSNAQNGLAVVQGIISGSPGVSCVAFTSGPSKDCVLPPTVADSLDIGNILSLSGNSGNAAVLNFTHTFSSTFDPNTPPPPPVPEPASLALLGLGLVAFAKRRR